MTKKIPLEFIGSLAGILTTISFLPQTIKVYKNGDIGGLSDIFLIILAVGLVIWVLYGHRKKSMSITIFSALQLIFIITILVKYYMVKNENKKEKYAV